MTQFVDTSGDAIAAARAGQGARLAATSGEC